jgi:hypothetical protein
MDERCRKQRIGTEALHGAAHVLEDERRKHVCFGISEAALPVGCVRPDAATTLDDRGWTFRSRLLEGPEHAVEVVA